MTKFIDDKGDYAPPSVVVSIIVRKEEQMLIGRYEILGLLPFFDINHSPSPELQDFLKQFTLMKIPQYMRDSPTLYKHSHSLTNPS